MKAIVAQSCTTLCNPMDYRPPGSSVHGIFQARILQWAAAPFSRGSSQPRDWTLVSRIASRFFSILANWEWFYFFCLILHRFPFFYSFQISIIFTMFFEDFYFVSDHGSNLKWLPVVYINIETIICKCV